MGLAEQNVAKVLKKSRSAQPFLIYIKKKAVLAQQNLPMLGKPEQWH